MGFSKVFVSVSRMGIQTPWGIIAFLGLGGTIASLFVAEIKKYSNYIAIVPAAATLIGLLAYLSFAGFGVFLSLIATGGLVAYSWMNKE